MPRGTYNKLDLMAVEYKREPNDQILADIFTKLEKEMCCLAKKYAKPPTEGWQDMMANFRIAIWKKALLTYKIERMSFFGYAKLTMECEGKNVISKLGRAKRIPKQLMIPMTDAWTEEGTILQKPDYNNWFVDHLRREETKNFLKWCKEVLSDTEKKALVEWFDRQYTLQVKEFEPARYSKKTDNAMERIKRKARKLYRKENVDFHIFEENAMVQQFALQVHCYRLDGTIH